MGLLRLIPIISYTDIRIGKKFFTSIGFEIKYEDELLCILTRDGATLHISQYEEASSGDRPELRIETDDIDAVYEEIKSKSPDLLHPNLKVVKQQPWGLREFALLDPTGVCIVFQQ